jgi:hypothetical protein
MPSLEQLNVRPKKTKVWVPPKLEPSPPAVPPTGVGGSPEGGSQSNREQQDLSDSSSQNSSSSEGEEMDCHPPTRRPPGSARGGMPSVRPNATKNRQRQLQMLKLYEERIKTQQRSKSTPQAGPSNSPGSQAGPSNSSGSQAGPSNASGSKAGPSNASGSKAGPSNDLASQAGRPSNSADVAMKTPSGSRRAKLVNPMYIHVMDVSQTVQDATATWLPIVEHFGGCPPEETIFYSLTEGRGELILFGGIQTDIHSMQRGKHVDSQTVSNDLHFISAKTVLR